MQTLTIGKKYTFDSAHTIVGHPKCGYVHGHTWELDLRLTATLDNQTGMVLDFNELNTVVRPIIATLDHQYLNDLNCLSHLPILTAETLVIELVKEIGHKLQPMLNRPFVLTCRLREGLGGWAEFKAAFGEEG